MSSYTHEKGPASALSFFLCAIARNDLLKHQMHRNPDFRQSDSQHAMPHPNPRQRVNIAKMLSETLPALHLLAGHAYLYLHLSYIPSFMLCYTLVHEPQYSVIPFACRFLQLEIPLAHIRVSRSPLQEHLSAWRFLASYRP